MFPNYLTEKSAEDTLVPPLSEKQGKMFVFKTSFAKAAARGGTCAFTTNPNALIKNSSRDDKSFDLDIESNHGQPASCRARSMNVDHGLEDIWWTSELGGQRLPAASYARLPNLKKGLLFAIGEESITFSSVFYTPAAKCFGIRRHAGPCHISPAVPGSL